MDHLDTDMIGLSKAREDLINQLQTIADENVQKFQKAQNLGLIEANVEEQILAGTEICYRGCGRYYHFTIKCCTETHKVKICKDLVVKYVVFNGKIFFDKCTAFSLMNRISVVKFGDFRTVDKYLEAKEIDISANFLSENCYVRNPSLSNNLRAKKYGRRTHISYEALEALVKSGFSADPECSVQARNLVEIIRAKSGFLKSKCSKYEGKSPPILTQDEPESSKFDQCDKFANQFDQDEEEMSSSGIESGSSASSSGKSSPVTEMLEDFDDFKQDFTDQILRETVELHLCIDNNNLYCDTSDFENLLNLKNEEVLKIIKRKYRSVDVDNSFLPKSFGMPKKATYFSVKCFKLLLAKNYIKKVNPTYKKAEIVKELERMMEKYETKMELEDDEEILLQNEENFPLKFPEEESDFVKIFEQTGPPMIKICDLTIPYQIKEGNIFLERKFLLSELCFVSGHFRNSQKMDEILTDAGQDLNQSFIWVGGKHRKYISISALKILLEKEYYGLKKPELQAQIEASLDKLIEEKSRFLDKNCLNLSSFEDRLPYKLSRGGIFLNTLAFLKLVGCSTKYLEGRPSNSYFAVLRLLKKKGMNIKGCFLKQGICKYGFISTKAALTLFKTDEGPFRNKKKMKLLQKELLEAIKEQLPKYASTFHKISSTSKEATDDNESKEDTIDVVLDTISIGDVKVKYQIKDGAIFFHRMTIFEAIGLEKALSQLSRGLPTINRILTSHKLEVSKSFLKSQDEQYGFISFEALWTILDAEDPLVTMLEKRSTFAADFLTLIQDALCKTIKKQLIFDAIPWKVENGKFMFEKAKTLAFSGMYDRAHILATYLEHVSLEQLMKFSKLESEQARSSGYSNLIWTDMISAVLHETPKLRHYITLIDFRQKFMQFLEVQLVSFLAKADSVRSDNQPNILESTEIKIKPDIEELIQMEVNTDSAYSEMEDSRDEDPENALELLNSPFTANHEDSSGNSSENEMEDLSLSEFSKIVEAVQVVRNGLIGDWHIKKCDDSEVRLIVNPGYGASKKISFVQPDVSAILKYELCLRPQEPPNLTINDLKVSYTQIEPVFKRELKRGLFGLLYNLLTLRPCFGNFQPELVETLEKRSRTKNSSATSNGEIENLVIDTNFIGSSQNGRTYAGTVRSKECNVLAVNKVSDMCNACNGLHCHVVINRSVLASPAKKNRTLSQESNSSTNSSNSTSVSATGNSKNSSNQTQQQSVWKVEESTVDGCTFLCPQLQSFNTSLPHQFVSASQASSVIEHRVKIAQDLTLKVSLNGRQIQGKTFGDFEKTKQVGPLLDHVASMRLCVGYPDPDLVNESRFVMEKKAALPNEIKKFFNYITVDEEFSGKMNALKSVIGGTMRANSCRFVASDHADICDQCRLLQEPLNFLGF